jgi:hypothetical protein
MASILRHESSIYLSFFCAAVESCHSAASEREKALHCKHGQPHAAAEPGQGSMHKARICKRSSGQLRSSSRVSPEQERAVCSSSCGDQGVLQLQLHSSAAALASSSPVNDTLTAFTAGP